MKRAGILLLVAAFATGCTTRKGATIGVVVGMGIIVTTGGVAAAQHGQNEGSWGAGFVLGALLTSGMITIALSGIVAAATPDPNELPPAPPPLPEDYVRRTEQLEQMKRVASRLAKDGHCDQVRELDLQVASRDLAFHGRVFVRDGAIKRCLGTN